MVSSLKEPMEIRVKVAFLFPNESAFTLKKKKEK